MNIRRRLLKRCVKKWNGFVKIPLRKGKMNIYEMIGLGNFTINELHKYTARKPCFTDTFETRSFI